MAYMRLKSASSGKSAPIFITWPQKVGKRVIQANPKLFKPYLRRNQKLYRLQILDTVKPNASWTYEPNKATELGDRIYGLGSNDAHASVVALIETFLRLRETEQSYNLILALSAQEEVSGKDGRQPLLTKLPKIDFAVRADP